MLKLKVHTVATKRDPRLRTKKAAVLCQIYSTVLEIMSILEKNWGIMEYRIKDFYLGRLIIVSAASARAGPP
jgi:hypothetical protein